MTRSTSRSTRLQDGDIWELRVADGDAATDSWIMDGVADGVTEVQDKFDMPNLGSADKDVRIKAYLIRNGETISPSADSDFVAQLAYVAPPPGSGGPTGSTGTTGDSPGTSTPSAAAGAAAVVGGTGTTDKSKSKSNSNSKKKSTTKNKSDSNSNNNNTGTKPPKTTPVTTPATPSPVVAAPVADTSAPTIAPPAEATVPDAPPPGVGGPPAGGDGLTAPLGDNPPSEPPLGSDRACRHF